MPTPLATGAPSAPDSITPGRQTRAVFDVPEDILQEDEILIVRKGAQIAPLAARDASLRGRFKTNVRFWKCGAITLAPLQESEQFQEKIPANPFVYVPPDSGSVIDQQMAVAINVLQLQIWKTNPGNGLVYGPGVQTVNGDAFFERQIDETETDAWTTGLLTAPAPYADLQNNLDTQTIGQGFIASSTQKARADQGFCLRFSIPGTQSHHPDYVGVFFFGGNENGSKPQYALIIKGDGQAELQEYGKITATSGYFWQSRTTFRYCRPAQVSNQTHKIIIWPCLGPNGEKFITFAGGFLDGSETASAGVLAVAGSAGTDAGASSMTEYVYQWNPAIAGTVDGSPGHATGEGYFWLSERKDLRNSWQVGKLRFQLSGTLYGAEIDLLGARAARNFIYQSVQTVPTATPTFGAFGLVAQIKIAHGPSNGQVVAQSGNGLSSVYVQWTFSGGDTSDTPILWQHSFRLPAVVEHIEPGAFSCPILRGNGAGADSDPQQESASVTVYDKLDEFQRLRRRGKLSFRLQTPTAPIAGNTDTFPVVLFRGTASRPHVSKRGRKNASFPNAREYGITAAGMWERLSRQTFRKAAARKSFAIDMTATPDATGVRPPWKATEAIKYLLSLCGFLPAQIRIEDNPIRLYPGIGAPPSDLIVDINTDVAQLAVRIARNYLGRFLHFAPNDGALGSDGVPVGQWILIGPPTAASPALWNFVSLPPEAIEASGGTPALHLLATYGDKTAYTMDVLEGYTAPPEANHVTVLTAPDIGKTGGMKIANEAYNFRSYHVPGSSIVPDPNSPHYLGYHAPLVIVDPTLWAGDGPDGMKNTQAAVDFMVARELTFACLPRRIRTVHAALVFVLDPVTNRRRPLRFYDKVTLDGQGGWLVRNVDPILENDRNQTAVYELERTIGLQENN